MLAANRFLEFLADDAGAVTVDWVVLTAAIVGLSIGVFTIITRDSVTAGGVVINNKLNEAVNTDFVTAVSPSPSP